MAVQLERATKVVYYRQEMDQDGTTDTGDKFSSDTIGVRYDIAGGLRIGLLHSNYDFTDAGVMLLNENGSATRLKSVSISKLYQIWKRGLGLLFYCQNL